MTGAPESTTIYLALGANLGDRHGQLAGAVARLAAARVAIRARSALYETDAISDDPQPPYLNAALRADTTRPPADLLALCLEIEAAFGRVRPAGPGKAARTLDIDILLYGDRIVDTPALTVPHPALLSRPFVRIPLAEVAAAGLRHPITGAPLDVALPSPAVRRFAADL